MKHAEIEVYFQEIKNILKKGRVNEAINKLDDFISKVDDEDLETELISYSSRYNKLENDKKLGVSGDEYNQEYNQLVRNLTSLLRETKNIAIEKASMQIGSQLSELAEEGSNAIDELKKLNVIIAESRLLELQVIKSMFGNFFSKSDLVKVEQNIESLKKVLNKVDDDYQPSENSMRNFFGQLNHYFEENSLGYQPNIDEMMNLVYQMRDRWMNQQQINISSSDKNDDEQ